jgi:hypothetical protein
MKKAHIQLEDSYSRLDRLIINNGYSIEYDTKSALKSRVFYINIIVKDNNDRVILTKKYDSTIGTTKMDEILYSEIVQIIRETKLNKILND